MKKNIFKILVIVMLLVLGSLCFTACDKTNSVEKVKITFVTNNQSENIIQNIEKGSVINELPIIEKEGYSFGGWYIDNGTFKEEFKGTTAINITVYSLWIPNINGIHFNGNGATGGEVDNFEIKSDETKALPLNAFIKTGYTFAGWATTADGEVIYSDGANYLMGIDKQVELYAVWTPDNDTTYTINYYLQNLNDNNYTIDDLKTQNLKGITDSEISADAIEINHFTFNSELSQASDIIKSDGSLILSLYYDREVYTITFDCNGGQCKEGDLIQTLKYQDNAVAPVLEKLGYTYQWNNDFNEIDGDMTINAIWTPNDDTLYKAEYFIQNIEKSDYIKDDSMNENLFGTTDAIATITPKDLKGFTLNTELSKLTGTISNDESLVLQVYFERDVYTITYDASNGTVSATTFDVVYQNNYTLLIPESNDENYVFDCWSYENEKVAQGGEWNLEGDITLVAQWKPIFTVENNTIYLADVGKSLTREINIPSTFEGQTITKIGNNGFKDSKASAINLPDTICVIEDRAFANCLITSIVIPKSVNIMGESILSNCNNLEEVTLPFIGRENNNIEDETSVIGFLFESKDYSANHEFGFISQYYSLANNNYSKYLYQIPSSLRKVILTKSSIIHEGAFSCLENLVTVDLSQCEGLTCIKTGAFYFNTGIQNVVLPEGLEILGEKAFFNCFSLNSIELPSTLTSIYSECFRGCLNLNNFVLPESICYLGRNCLMECNSITELNLPEVPVEHGSIIQYLCSENNLNIQKIIIEQQIETLPSYAFENADNLQEVILPDSLITIEHHAFNNCDDLQKIRIGNNSNLKYIMEYAVANCNQLEYFFIPEKVTNIEAEAFVNSNKNFTVYCFESEAQANWQINWDKRNNNSNIKKQYSTTILFSDIMDYIVKNNEATIFNYNDDSVIDLIIPNIINGINIVSIGDNVFKNNCNLNSVFIPNTIKNIGQSSFNGCINLTTVIFEDGSVLELIDNAAFCNCNNLENLILPQSLKIIDEYAFSQNKKLTTLTIPASVEEINKSAFEWCSELQSVVFEGNKIIELETGVFALCESLTSITIPDSVTAIDDGAFDGSGAFDGCISLQTVTFGVASVLNSVGNYAFNGCSSLIGINLPSTVTNIGNYAFNGCKLLAEVQLPNSLINIGNYAFNGCRTLSNVQLPNTVTNVGVFAYNGCSSLIKFVSSDNLQNLGTYAFKGCTALNYVELNGVLTSIPMNTFDNCSSLDSIVISKTITLIDDSAFINCNNLNYVYYKGTSAEWANVNIVDNNNSAIISATVYYYSETAPTESGDYWHYNIDNNIEFWAKF